MLPTRVVKRPPYAVEAVDHALQVLLYLKEREDVGVSEVAGFIGTATSTAHRILSTLVYRGFAEHDGSHRYRLGPAMDQVDSPENHLKTILRPHLVGLREATGETASAMVLEGVRVRLLLTVESTQRLRITDRSGSTLSAAHASAGKALLAQLSPSDLRQLYTGYRIKLTGDDLGAQELARLERELEQVRRHGVAYNERRTEADLVAVGCAVPSRRGRAWLGLAVNAPIERGERVRDPELHAVLRRCAGLVGAELAERGITALEPPEA